MRELGNDMFHLAQELWPINRSITGAGLRSSLMHLKKEYLPDLALNEVPSGTQVLDWTVPQEWSVKDAYIICPDGRVICEFKKCNLHLVGYSTGVNLKLSLDELIGHLHSLPEQPDAIPYVTSYYKKDWGFCISHREKMKLSPGIYEVYIDAKLFNGSLTYAELLLPGDTSEEVLISTYVCHPSMANNELSGPVVTTFLAKWLSSKKDRKLSYRIIFVPETIGSITYLSRHLDYLKKNVIAGFNVTCIGDDRTYSFLPSRAADTLSDKVATHVLEHIDKSYKVYDWNDRGSDERQYCAPGVDLPIASIMRSKYGEYPEYHTSLDALGTVVTPSGLYGGFTALKKAIQLLEKNCYPVAAILGEPHMSKRGAYPTLSVKSGNNSPATLMNFLTWSDGKHDLIDIAKKIKVPGWELFDVMDQLHTMKLITIK